MGSFYMPIQTPWGWPLKASQKMSRIQEKFSFPLLRVVIEILVTLVIFSLFSI